MSADQAIRNGTDLMLVNYSTATNDVQFRDTNGAQQAMRTAAKNVLYVVANSRAYYEENYNPGMASWKIIMILADVVVGALCCFILYNAFIKKRENEVKVEAQAENKTE